MEKIISQANNHEQYRAISVKQRIFGIILLVLAYGIQSASAQLMTIFPSCGKVGDTIEICGSGWAEPDPVCDYWFLLDGTEVAARQPDGLFGPPNTTFVIPTIAVGDHTVRTELRLTEDATLLQARNKTLKVIDAAQQPLSATRSDSNHRINITYDPEKACFNECTKIYFIQTRNTRRILDDGTNEHLPYNEEPHSWANGDAIESTFVNDVAIDRIYGKPVPYYGIPPGAAQIGSKVEIGPSQPAKMSDRPKRSDASYAANVDTIKILFEVNAFCGEGEEAGKWLGSNLTWEWSRDKGAADSRGTVTVGAVTDSQPTPAFHAALNKWKEKNPAFKLPKPKFMDCSGAL